MGWWRTGSGGVIGDGPADIVDEPEDTIRVPEDIPIGLLSRIHEEYCREWDRNPTRQELGELIEFCLGAKGG